jgi:hypothetical protein
MRRTSLTRRCITGPHLEGHSCHPVYAWHTRGSQVVVIGGDERPTIVAGDTAVSFGELGNPRTEGQLLVRSLNPEMVWLTHEHRPWKPGAIAFPLITGVRAAGPPLIAVMHPRRRCAGSESCSAEFCTHRTAPPASYRPASGPRRIGPQRSPSRGSVDRVA